MGLWGCAGRWTPGGSLLPHVSCRSLSTGRLTDLLLKAAFGAQAPDSGSSDSLHEKPMEIGEQRPAGPGGAPPPSPPWGHP